MAQAPVDLTGIDRPLKETLRDQIYGRLRAAVMDGRFLPGQHLGIVALAEALNVSPMPVREALRQLVAEGALEMLPNRMVKVPLMTAARFQEILDLRITLEGRAAALAAPGFTREQCAALKALSGRMTEAVQTGDVSAYFALNREFHFLIYGAAQSAVLMELIESLWLRAGPFIRLSYGRSGQKATETNHAKAIRAMRERDPAAAAEAIRLDLMDAAALIEKTGFAAPHPAPADLKAVAR